MTCRRAATAQQSRADFYARRYTGMFPGGCCPAVLEVAAPTEGHSRTDARGLSPAMSRADRRSGGCRGGVRRRQAQGAAARRCPRHARTSFRAAAPAGFPGGISRDPSLHERGRSAGRSRPRRHRLRGARRRPPRQRHDCPSRGNAGGGNLRRPGLHRATWASVWVRAFFAYGISRSIPQRSTLSAGHGPALDLIGRPRPSARPYRPATAQRSTLSAGHGL
jgi:hypothetical protein